MLMLSVLLVALASPVPKPEPTNPFTVDTTPAQPLQHIGSTRSRPLCTALRQVVAPTLKIAMKNDASTTELRVAMYDFMVSATDISADMKIMRMDREVQTLHDSISTLQDALNAPAWNLGTSPSPDDTKSVAQMRQSMLGTLESQKVQLQAMSGLVDTERQIRLGTATEDERMMRKATSGDQSVIGANGTPQQADLNSLPTVNNEAFKRDTANVLSTPVGHIAVSDAQKLDADLKMLAARTDAREKEASALIVTAAKSCY
jgi:hypothetical protein